MYIYKTCVCGGNAATVAVRHASLKQCVTARGAYTLSIRIAPAPCCHNTFEWETTLRDKKVNIQAPPRLPTTLVQEHVTPYFTCFQHSPPIPHLQSRLHFLHYSPLSPPPPAFFPFFVAVSQRWCGGEICTFHMLPLVELAGWNASIFTLFFLRNTQKARSNMVREPCATPSSS